MGGTQPDSLHAAMMKAVHAYADSRSDKLAGERLSGLTLAIDVRSHRTKRGSGGMVYNPELVFSVEGQVVCRTRLHGFLEASVWAQEYTPESSDDPATMYGVTATPEGRDLVERLAAAFKAWKGALRQVDSAPVESAAIIPFKKPKAKRDGEREVPPELVDDMVIGTNTAALFCGYSTAQWRDLVSRQEAPQPIKFSARRLGWQVRDLKAWIQTRKKATK